LVNQYFSGKVAEETRAVLCSGQEQIISGLVEFSVAKLEFKRKEVKVRL